MLNFKKMHGLGNDFVIIDTRENGVKISSEQVRIIADRRRGIGCDQVILIERSKNWIETNFMRIFNPNGTQAEACGNAARCVADLLMNEDGVDNVVIETIAGALNCFRVADNLIRVEMGQPKFDWNDIPLSKQCDSLYLEGLEYTDTLKQTGKEDLPVAVSMGNPHCVFFVKSLNKYSDELIKRVGEKIESDPLFPKKTNVEFVEILNPEHIRMRVWERSAGITQACGSGACAAVVAAIRRDLTARKVTVTLDGGDLTLEWPDDDTPVSMTGPATYVFDGTFKPL